MAKLNAQDVIASLKEMTILELNELVKAIETEFGVSAAAPVAAAAAESGGRMWPDELAGLLLPLKLLLLLPPPPLGWGGASTAPRSTEP